MTKKSESESMVFRFQSSNELFRRREWVFGSNADHVIDAQVSHSEPEDKSGAGGRTDFALILYARNNSLTLGVAEVQKLHQMLGDALAEYERLRTGKSSKAVERPTPEEVEAYRHELLAALIDVFRLQTLPNGVIHIEPKYRTSAVPSDVHLKLSGGGRTAIEFADLTTTEAEELLGHYLEKVGLG